MNLCLKPLFTIIFLAAESFVSKKELAGSPMNKFMEYSYITLQSKESLIKNTEAQYNQRQCSTASPN